MAQNTAIDAAMDSQWRTDVGTLWTAAVAKHNQKVGIKFKLDQSKAMNTPWDAAAMRDTLNKLAEQFEKERDSTKHLPEPIKGPAASALKVTKDATQVILHIASTIGAIAGTVFAPAPIIAEGLVFVLRATEKVSAQLDQIEKFFSITASLFKRLAGLEGRLPDGPIFAQQLLDVFDRLLGFITDAQVYVGRGKLKNFFKELAKPSTPLSDTHAMFQNQLNQLDSSAIFCTLGLSVDIKKKIADIRDSVDLIAHDTHHIVGQIDGLSMNIIALRMQLGNFRQDFRSFSYEVRHKPAVEQVRKQIGDTVAVDRVSYRSNVLRTLRASFDIGDTESLHQRRLARMLSSRLPGTCEWIHDHKDYQALFDESSRFLLIQGIRHSGRSMLSSFIFEHIKTFKQQPLIDQGGIPTEPASISVAYFCFSQELGGRNSVDDMIRCCIMQIAEQDPAYQKWAMDHCLQQKSQQGENTNPTWDDYFTKRFSPSASVSPPPWLFLILDDVDIAESRDHLIGFQQSIEKQKLRISLVCTATSNGDFPISKWPTVILGTRSANASNANAANNDLRTFTKHLAMSLSRLGALEQEMLESLVNAVCEKATTYLYVDYALRRFNVIGGSDLTPLSAFKTTCDGIYQDLFDACTHHRNAQEKAQLQCLFTWLAFCDGHYLSLGAAKVLLKLVARWPVFQPKESKSSHKNRANAKDEIKSGGILGLAAGNELNRELTDNLSL